MDKTKSVSVDEYTKDKVNEDLLKLNKKLIQLEMSIKNHADELKEKESKLENIKSDLDKLNKLKKYLGMK